mgnify:CR=1 FL=1
MLKSQADYLIVEHPNLSSQIQAGLLLAVAGRVKPIGDPAEALTRNWEVLGETYEGTQCKVYTVRDLDTTPRRWSCNCEQGQTYGPLTPDFIGHPGRICKHIAAVGILWLACEYPEKPASLWDLFTRLVQEQAIYLVAGEAVELPTPHKVKMEYYNGLRLKRGRVRSEILARWVLPVDSGEWRVESPQGGLPKADEATDSPSTLYASHSTSSKGEWRLVGEAESRYQEFVSKINGSFNV